MDDMRMPFISIVIPAYNEENYIGKCLKTILDQDYPSQKYEVLIIDGGSQDKTKEIIGKYLNKADIRLLYNSRRITSTALNIGIKESKGEVIVILGAHSYVGNDFLTQNINAINRSGAKCVGGTLINVGNNYISKSIAMALSSIFGVGNAYFRFTKKERFVDTVAYGAYLKDVFDEIGLFDERLERNQDIELNYRLKNKGYEFFLTPSIKIFYNCRKNMMEFIKQYFQTGFWNIKMLRTCPNSLSWRHFIPMIFVLFLGLSLLIAALNFYGRLLLSVILGMYFMLALIFSLVLALKHGLRYLPVLPLAFFILHLSYGIGSLVGILKFKTD